MAEDGIDSIDVSVVGSCNKRRPSVSIAFAVLGACSEETLDSIDSSQPSGDVEGSFACGVLCIEDSVTDVFGACTGVCIGRRRRGRRGGRGGEGWGRGGGVGEGGEKGGERWSVVHLECREQ